MSRLVKWSLPVLAFAVIVSLAGVRADAQEGTGAAAQGKVTGTIHNEDGTPAANVTVRLVAAMTKESKKAEKDAAKAERDAAKAEKEAHKGEKGKGGAKPQAAQEGAGGAKPADEAPARKPERPKPVAEGKTDAAGKFELEAPPGKYTVMANLRGSGRVQKTVELKAGKTEDVGTLVLKRQAPKKEEAPKKEGAPTT